MFAVAKFDVPEGLPIVDTVRSRQLNQLGSEGLPILNTLDSEEREALFTSLSNTVRATDYHVKRFNALLESINERRKTANAIIASDFTVEYAVFEAAAGLSAMRSAVDEIIFIAARCASISEKDIASKWHANDVMKPTFPRSAQAPAVDVLRRRGVWYQELNDYRNAYRHRGSRDTISPYFPLDTDFPEAKNADRNVMLLPDLESLQKGERPSKWTYKNGVRLETVLARTVVTFEEVIDELISKEWGGADYVAREWIGKIAAGEYNMFLLFCRPALHVLGEHLMLPVFSTRERAHTFIKDSTGADHLHLVELTPNEEGHFALDLTGYKDQQEFAKLKGSMIVCLDPEGFIAMGQNATGKARAYQETPLAPFLADYNAKLLAVTEEGMKGAERLFVWRVPSFV